MSDTFTSASAAQGNNKKKLQDEELGMSLKDNDSTIQSATHLHRIYSKINSINSTVDLCDKACVILNFYADLLYMYIESVGRWIKQ